MLKAAYLFFLIASSIEDARYHKVNNFFILFIILIGYIRMGEVQERRWVSLILTCFCFFVFYLFYQIVIWIGIRRGKSGGLGGADVKIMFGMMLAQGWDTALTGILIGLVAAIGFIGLTGQWRKEIPLVPWISAGCIGMELIFPLLR